MKPSLRLPRAPSTSRPKPPDGPTTPRSGGALFFSAESRKLLTYETVLAPEASLVRNALSNALGDSRVSMWALAAKFPCGVAVADNKPIDVRKGATRKRSQLKTKSGGRTVLYEGVGNQNGAARLVLRGASRTTRE